MDSNVIRVGLVGFGLAGSVFHAPLIQACERMELTAILSSRDVPLRVGSLDELLRVSDLVVIASPNASHYPIARKALEAQRHVLVDKPFTVSLGEADKLIALASERRLILSVFHNRRFDSDFLTLRELIPQLGEVKLFEANWDRFRPAIKQGWREDPQAGAGLLNDLGPHLIDQVLQLFGLPQAIEADIATQREHARTDDYFDLTLHYGARRVCLRSSTLAAAPRPRFSVHGTAGSFVKYGLDPQEAQLKAGMHPHERSFGADPNDGTLTHGDGSSVRVPTLPGRYLAFYEALATAILDGAPVPVCAGDAREGLALISLARRAAAEGRLQLKAASLPEG